MTTEPKLHDWVTVPPVEGNISSKKQIGYVTGVMGKFCRVEIHYGKGKEYWDGLWADVKQA